MKFNIDDKDKILHTLSAYLLNKFNYHLYDACIIYHNKTKKPIIDVIRDYYIEYLNNIKSNPEYVQNFLKNFYNYTIKYLPDLKFNISDLNLFIVMIFIPNNILHNMDTNDKALALNDIIIKIIDRIVKHYLTGGNITELHKYRQYNLPKNYINNMDNTILKLLLLVEDEIKATLLNNIDDVHDRSKYIPIKEYGELFTKCKTALETLIVFQDKNKSLEAENESLKNEINKLRTQLSNIQPITYTNNNQNNLNNNVIHNNDNHIKSKLVNDSDIFDNDNTNSSNDNLSVNDNDNDTEFI